MARTLLRPMKTAASTGRQRSSRSPSRSGCSPSTGNAILTFRRQLFPFGRDDGAGAAGDAAGRVVASAAGAGGAGGGRGRKKASRGAAPPLAPGPISPSRPAPPPDVPFGGTGEVRGR